MSGNSAEYFIELIRGISMGAACGCFPRTGSKADKQPLIGHIEETGLGSAKRLVDWLSVESPGTEPRITEERIQDLCNLAYSDQIDRKEAAAVAFVELCQRMTQPVPEMMLPPIIKLLQSPDYEVQKPASLALTHLATRGPAQNKILIVQSGALTALIALLQSPHDDIRCNASGCITTLATLDTTKRQIAVQGAIPPLIVLIQNTDIKRHAILRNATGALLNLSHIEINRYDLHRAGASKEFMRLLSSEDEDVQFYSCAALSNLAVHSSIRIALTQEQDGLIFDALIRLLSSRSEKVNAQAAYVIRNLASADENQTKFVEHGVLPPLHALILSQQNSSIIASLAALRNLSIHPKNEIAIMEDGFPDLLSDIIKDSKLPDMLNHAIGTIRNLCTQEQHETLVNQYNIPTVLAEKMGQEELRNEHVQGEITSCLAVLASYRNIRPALVALYDNKFLEVAVSWAEKGFNEVRYNTLGILGYLCESEENRELLINKTRILEVIKNFLQSPEAPYVHIGLWAIQQLLNNAADSTKQSIRNCGLELLVKRHTVNHDVKEISDMASNILKILSTI